MLDLLGKRAEYMVVRKRTTGKRNAVRIKDSTQADNIEK